MRCFCIVHFIGLCLIALTGIQASAQDKKKEVPEEEKKHYFREAFDLYVTNVNDRVQLVYAVMDPIPNLTLAYLYEINMGASGPNSDAGIESMDAFSVSARALCAVVTRKAEAKAPERFTVLARVKSPGRYSGDDAASYTLTGTVEIAEAEPPPPEIIAGQKGALFEPEQIKQAVTDLGHDNFAVRTRATKQLQASANMAIPELLANRDNDDPEIRARIQALIKKLPRAYYFRVLVDESLFFEGKEPREILERIEPTE